MFKLVDIYIGKAIAASTFFSVIVLTTLSGLIRFIEQLKYTDRGTYDITDAALFVLYSMPRDLEVFFPMAALLGGLLGLGTLASNSELIVMQSAGVSKFGIVRSVMKTTTILVVIVLLIGEYLVPKLALKANQLREFEMNGNQQVQLAEIWLKDASDFVHVEDASQPENLKGITLYQFNSAQKLESVIHAQQALFNAFQTNQNQFQSETIQNGWLLKGIEITTISEQQITSEKRNDMVWETAFTPDKLTIVSATPEALSITELSDFLDYLSINEQETERYQLAFWRKILQPVTVAVMILLALSFIFGPLRSTSMGARILMGVVTGFGFFIVNRIFGSVVLVYDLSPILGAVLPSGLFALIALHFIKKAG